MYTYLSINIINVYYKLSAKIAMRLDINNVLFNKKQKERQVSL